MDKWYVSMGDFKKLYMAESAGHAAQKLLGDAIKEKAKMSVFIIGHRAGWVSDIQDMDDNEKLNNIEMMFTHKVMKSLLLDIEPLIAEEWQKVIDDMEKGLVKHDWGDPEINRFMDYVTKELS